MSKQMKVIMEKLAFRARGVVYPRRTSRTIHK
jgi:hypothetical protein